MGQSNLCPRQNEVTPPDEEHDIDRRPATELHDRAARTERRVLASLLTTAGLGALCALVGMLALQLGGPTEWLTTGVGGVALMALALATAQGRIGALTTYRVLAGVLGAGLIVLQGAALIGAGDGAGSRSALQLLPVLAPFVYVLAFHAWEAEFALVVSGLFLTLAACLPAALVALGLAPSPGAGALLRFFLALSVLHTLLIGLILLFARHRREAVAARESIAELGLLVRTDPLTGALNRRGLIEQLWTEADRSGSRPCRLALIFVDLDHFKRVNDRWGHPGGDQVLRAFSELLSRLVRTSDVLGRWGGEEFVVLMRRPTPGEALFMADRLRREVEEYSFPVVGHITASFGVAELGPGESVTDVIAAADEALYRAKAQGRNRTCASRSMMDEMAATRRDAVR